MSVLLDVGSKCDTCGVVDFLPFTCPSCSHIFCKEHVHSHGCSEPDAQVAGGSKRARQIGECSRPGCSAETIESIGGREAGLEGGGGDGIAKEVRCMGCGEAFCIAHRSQASHDCAAPRAETAQHDATLARRAAAQEVLARTMPQAAGKERMKMPVQVDKTRMAPAVPQKLPPSVLAERAEAAGSSAAPAAAAPSPAKPTSADERVYKIHTTKLRSLAAPLLPSANRDTSVAVEWAVDADGKRLETWIAKAGKYAPSNAATEITGKKAERVLVPRDMPGGKLVETIVARAKGQVKKDSPCLVRVGLKPGEPRTPHRIILSLPAGEQMDTGDLLVLVQSWPE